jgi:hypothetical protein
MICHHCGEEIRVEGSISRADECPKCSSDLHSCLNCSNYSVSAHNRCLEPQAEWVPDREKANFCDYFIPNKLGARGATSPGKDTRSVFESLFKK